MATITDKYLTAYKQLESELKCEDKTVMDYENSLEGIDQEKMKVCILASNISNAA